MTPIIETRARRRTAHAAAYHDNRDGGASKGYGVRYTPADGLGNGRPSTYIHSICERAGERELRERHRGINTTADPPTTIECSGPSIDATTADTEVMHTPTGAIELTSWPTSREPVSEIEPAPKSTRPKAPRAQRLPAGEFRAGEKIFVGFHRKQVELAGRFDTFDTDYRQAIFAAIDYSGHIHIRLRTSNMRWLPVPSEYRLRGVSSVIHEDIIYCGEFANICYDDVRREVARQSLLSKEEREYVLWVPTPPASQASPSRWGQYTRPAKKRGRPKGSRNRKPPLGIHTPEPGTCRTSKDINSSVTTV